MASDKKEVFPMIPLKWWRDLRRKFKSAIPSSIPDSYIASVLSIQASSAKSVAIPQFKIVGIVNSDGTLNEERARAWRDDGQYPQVCQTIVKEVYPQELLDVFPEPTTDDRRSIEQWFARKTGVGDRASRAMTSFYLMLSEADPTKAIESGKPKEKRPKIERVDLGVREKSRVEDGTDKRAPKVTSVETSELGVPSININIEVHISSDTESTQIDHIFESMAKHLNIRRKSD